MKFAAALLALLLLPFGAIAQAPADAPVVRTATDPTDSIVIGQPVSLRVQVLFPGEMPHPPLVKVRDAPGAQILRFETQALTIRERIDGRDYVGQLFEFVVFPRRPGEITIPAPDITLLNRTGDPLNSAKGEAVRIAATVPPGINPSGPVLVADRVSVSETWSPEPGATFRAGGAITRTIHREAAGVPALAMAEFRFDAPDGVRVYADPPVVEDRIDRGAVDGRRTDKVTYVFERAGNFVLPELKQPWWSLSAKQARTETLAGVTLSVAAGTASDAHPPPARWRPTLGETLGIAAAVAAMLGLLLFRAEMSALIRNSLDRYRGSEAFARRALIRATKRSNPPVTYRALAAWQACLSDIERTKLHSDRDLSAAIGKLDRVLFARGGAWRPQDAASLRHALSSWREMRASPSSQSALPPLNPASPGRRDRAD